MDYAAATPVDGRVLSEMTPYFSEKFFNPSALYLDAKDVKVEIENARSKVANMLGAKPSEIIYTAGGTEANNLAIAGIMNQYPDGNIVISSIEHPSVLEPARQYDCREVKVDKTGVIDLVDLEAKIDDKTILVSVMYANNEIGTLQPLREVAAVLQKVRSQRTLKGNDKSLLLHADACQAANYLDLHVARLGVDLMTLNGGKIYGPKQTGVLFVKTGVVLKPQILGGGQEKGARSGTENVAGAVGFTKALEIAQKMRKEEVSRLLKIQDEFISGLKKRFPNCTINGSKKSKLPNNISVTIPPIDNERVVMELDERGVQCAVGSACSVSKEEPSHVLKAIGLTENQAQSTLRFSMGRSTTKNDIKSILKALGDILNA